MVDREDARGVSERSSLKLVKTLELGGDPW
jgi:hypothetical protein